MTPSSEPPNLVGSRISHFRLVEQIGEGAFGRVYRAFDEHLHCDVAIKVLVGEDADDPAAIARLLREARLAAKLEHVNICRVFDADEYEGRGFIVMEFVRGRPLNALIPSGGMRIDEAIRYGIQIADALEHAHDKGVIHRDLKPSNVVVTTADRRAKVLDFGLARRVASPADPGSDSSRQSTRVDGVVGTPPYMAPEAWVGLKDVRSDLWALGVMLHEMCSGSLPFDPPADAPADEDARRALLMTSIVKDPPAALPPHVPSGVRTVIGRLLAKQPGDRYAHAAECRAALEALSAPPPPPPWPRWLRKLSWALSGALLAAIIWWIIKDMIFPHPASGGDIRSLAVLLFVYQSSDPAHEYFPYAMTDELSNKLSLIDSLRVISIHPITQYKNTNKPLEQIASDLGVNGLVEGSVFRSGDQVHITVRLYDAPWDKAVWAGEYEGDLKNPIGLLREVAGDITRKIKLTMTPNPQKHRGPVNP